MKFETRETVDNTELFALTKRRETIW